LHEIWHAGDFGTFGTGRKVKLVHKPVTGVYGNIDGPEINSFYPLNKEWTCEQTEVLMTQYRWIPRRYDPAIKKD
jgi:predicted phosphodiesterase